MDPRRWMEMDTRVGSAAAPQLTGRRISCRFPTGSSFVRGRGREEWGTEPPICLMTLRELARLRTRIWTALLSGLLDPAGPRLEEPPGRAGAIG